MASSSRLPLPLVFSGTHSDVAAADFSAFALGSGAAATAVRVSSTADDFFCLRDAFDDDGVTGSKSGTGSREATGGGGGAV